MISYIFKNKTKNILAIVFTVLYIVSSDFLREIYFSIAHGTQLSVYGAISPLPYILILVYLLTRKRQFKFKNVLFPMAFAILTAKLIYSAAVDIIYNLSSYGYLILFDILSYISYIISILAYVLCFIGSIYNFKNVVFLKIGVIIKIVATVVITVTIAVTEFITLGGMQYFKTIDENYSVYVYSSMVQTATKMLISLLFYVGILLLTLNKKSEYIDITPYVKERKAKKEAKRAAKLEAKQQEEAKLNAPVPKIPDGAWRCMACGAILSDSADRCECGYKK